MRLFLAVLAAAISLGVLTWVAEAESGVHVTALDCESHPRRIRVENQGDTAQDLSGWQLQSDPAEGQPFDLGEVGSLAAGHKVFVFEGHLSPAPDATVGYYRWGADENFNLRANDPTDYVRIVDAQGNMVDQRNCEGLAPGATPAPTTIYDPPPLVTPAPAPVETATPAPLVLAPATTAAPTARGTANPKPTSATVRPSTPAIGGADAPLPASGGPPGARDRAAGLLALAAGVMVLASGAAFVVAGAKRRG